MIILKGKRKLSNSFMVDLNNDILDVIVLNHPKRLDYIPVCELWKLTNDCYKIGEPAIIGKFMEEFSLDKCVFPIIEPHSNQFKCSCRFTKFEFELEVIGYGSTFDSAMASCKDNIALLSKSYNKELFYVPKPKIDPSIYILMKEYKKCCVTKKEVEGYLSTILDRCYRSSFKVGFPIDLLRCHGNDDIFDDAILSWDRNQKSNTQKHIRNLLLAILHFKYGYTYKDLSFMVPITKNRITNAVQDGIAGEMQKVIGHSAMMYYHEDYKYFKKLEDNISRDKARMEKREFVKSDKHFQNILSNGREAQLLRMADKIGEEKQKQKPIRVYDTIKSYFLDKYLYDVISKSPDFPDDLMVLINTNNHYVASWVITDNDITNTLSIICRLRYYDIDPKYFNMETRQPITLQKVIDKNETKYAIKNYSVVLKSMINKLSNDFDIVHIKTKLQ